MLRPLQAIFARTAHLALIPPQLPSRVKHVHRIPSGLLTTWPVSVILDPQEQMVDRHARCVKLVNVKHGDSVIKITQSVFLQL